MAENNKNKNPFDEVSSIIAESNSLYIRIAESLLIRKLRRRPGLSAGMEIFQETFLRLAEGTRKWEPGYVTKTTFTKHMISVINCKYGSEKYYYDRFKSIETKRTLSYNPVNELNEGQDTKDLIEELIQWSENETKLHLDIVLEHTLDGWTPQQISEIENIDICRVKYLKKLIKKKAEELCLKYLDLTPL